MLDLDLSPFQQHLELSTQDKINYVFDPVRKRRLIVQPEELVRQVWIKYLHLEYKVAFASLAVEKQLKEGQILHRYDLVFYKKGIPHILFEFKSFNTQLDYNSCLQIANYNKQLRVPYLVLSNGVRHHVFEANQHAQTIFEINELPL